MTDSHNKYSSAAAQMCSVMASTACIAPIWREAMTESILENLVNELVVILESGIWIEGTVEHVLERVLSLGESYRTAWAALNDLQRQSCLNALRNIAAEVILSPTV